ncbi:threonylcarbamoyl-AMP synthase [Muribaculaceae bacterium Isolate-042 (Harlan)]|uniref:L-threonylcarbamoyladenylate synthase n=1 Tax=Muribaculum intestinale TaxID=1796646 RepID=UPI000F487FC6|nr:L-threonylcarbamoyladenylate synthase [Muribaculum intestinale]ROS82779.1 threonylcarbamoyl-AMP synthase [Muribaculaceae bacterium Isolate-042 (Harlan)]
MTTILRTYETSINERYIEVATKALKDGQLIVYPTDTLYAIGCDALNARAIERICRLKNINPQKVNLSIICNDISQAAEYVRIDNRAYRILKSCLPGPYTFILPAATTLPKIFKGRKVVGVRIPNNDIARCLAHVLGNPLLSASALSETDVDFMHEIVNPEMIARRYESEASFVIDGGEGRTVSSTVVDLTDSSNPVIVREGAGNFEM